MTAPARRSQANTPRDDRAQLPPPPRAVPDTMALFLDLDGTLLDFADHPDAVAVDPALPGGLRRLRERLHGALAPLSGRPLAQIDALLGMDAGAAAGLHGGEVRAADGTVARGAPGETRLERLLDLAHGLLAGVPGVLVEPKPAGLALHWRAAPDQAGRVRLAAAELARAAGAEFELQPGNHVIELKRAGTDKGAAVRTLMREPPFRDRQPWVLGDDLTDEHAFEAANACGGVSIVVGPRRPTAARHALDGPAAARAWLAALAEGAP
jgi:trehalose 6-phosphate phosphatase